MGSFGKGDSRIVSDTIPESRGKLNEFFSMKMTNCGCSRKGNE